MPGVPPICQAMIPLSVLDLAPIPEGSDAGQSLRNSADLARQPSGSATSASGWPSIIRCRASPAPPRPSRWPMSAANQHIRIGAGGIMLPNHAPLVIAEQFGTLEALFPGRVDLGLGRAPGTDQAAAYALRRNLASDENQFPQRCARAEGLFPRRERPRSAPFPARARTSRSGSSGRACSAPSSRRMLGLPYAFASHFAPQMMMEAIALYRERFQPSEQLDRAVCDARLQRLRRRHRRGGAAARDVGPAGVRRASHRPADPAAAAASRLCGHAAAECARDPRQRAVLLGDRHPGHGAGAGRSLRRSAPAPTN